MMQSHWDGEGGGWLPSTTMLAGELKFRRHNNFENNGNFNPQSQFGFFAHMKTIFSMEALFIIIVFSFEWFVVLKNC